MRNLFLLALGVAGLMLVSLTALAIDLDETVCEDDLGGTWDAGSSTCDTGFLFLTVDPLVVPVGVTLLADFVDTFDVTVTNFGTITVDDDWHNHGLLDNYGSFTASFMIHDEVVNHCGATYDVDFDGSLSTTFLDCSVSSAIAADPTDGTAPLEVDWTVTLSNDGDDNLTEVTVELSNDGGATAFSTLSSPPDSGDDLDGVLEPGETWQWVVQTVENDDVTVTATASGTALSGLVVTFPDDAEARSMDSVTVAAAPTTTTSTTSTTSPTSTTVPPPSTTSTSPTTSVEVGAGTLPFTGGTAGGGIATLAVALGALGFTLVAATRPRRTED